MGWHCKDCGNTESFTEINKVETLVSQEKNTTKVKKILNKYMDRPLLDVRCNTCMSKHVRWIDSPHQDDNYIFEQDGYVTENHTINTIVFELTNKCDINCSYCPKTGPQELDFEIVKKIVYENSKLRIPIKHFELGYTGNQLLHARIGDIVKLLDSHEYKVNVFTNGKNLIQQIKIIKPSQHISFTIFLDHPDQEENDKLMGEKVFSNTIKSLDYLQEKGIGFNIYMRLSRHNYDKIREMKELLKKYPSTSLVPIEIYPLGKTTESVTLTDEMKQKVVDTIEDLKLTRSIHFSPALLRANCTYQRKLRLFINSNGKLSFCHFLSSLSNADIIDVKDKTLLELIQINNKVRSGFLKNKEKLFLTWTKPRIEASPCSYCLHSFGLNKKW